MDIDFNLTAPIILAVGLAIIAGLVLTILSAFVKKKEAPKPAPEETVRKRAVVLCSGITTLSPNESEYQGHDSCKSAKLYFGGPRSCKYGCIGLGDCVRACPQKAIEVCNGLANIDRNKCDGCGACKDVCPQGLIRIFPKSQRIIIGCSSKDPEQIRYSVCKAACVSCGACKKVCGFDAISFKSGAARIDPNKCVSCGECKSVCPQKCIHTVTN